MISLDITTCCVTLQFWNMNLSCITHVAKEIVAPSNGETPAPQLANLGTIVWSIMCVESERFEIEPACYIRYWDSP